ncbi:MAG: transcriptional repressor LexA [Proteobacteria bacterium]|nr:transcriptional repressor LexA [Pseudomonadota bacterium]NIS69078.1 transcriptional repressor LexA [Pseudomonadota bacterium]
MGLTDRQRQILNFIKQSILKEGFPPSIREIGEHFGIYPRAAFDHVKALEKKGFVKRSAAKSRGIEVRDFMERDVQPDARQVPLLGRVTAGRPVLAVENIESIVCIPRDWARGEEVFLLRVKGDSMAPFIMDGDLALVRSQASADNGDVVVALLEDEATIKRFYRENRHVVLKPDNAAWETLRMEEGTPGFRLIGKVIGVYRRI